MLAKGGMSQADIAASVHVSKRQVSAAAKAIKEHCLTFDDIASMDANVIDKTFFPKEQRRSSDAYLIPDIESFIERKKKTRKLPIKLFWFEYCERAEAAGKLAYSYQSFCEMFSDVAQKTDAVRHFDHEPGAKCYIDWAGDVAYLTDKTLGIKTKVYVLIVCLPFSDKFYAEGFRDMKQKSWQLGQMHAFEAFGGVPRMLVPDNATTATDRSALAITLVNAEYERFAEHYGAAIVPARVRKPRDKSVAESTTDLVEKWVIGPALELTFYTLEEFNEFCFERIDWLNTRPFSAKDGSRDEVFEAEEQAYLLPLPDKPYEMCEWRCAKVSPDYHVTIDYMHYSVDHSLIGKQVDVKLTDTKVTIMYGGEVIATHVRLHGRRGQYSTIVDHMPKNHAALESPWSPARFTSWADKIGPECRIAIERVMDSRPIVEQSFVSCRNMLGLSKTYTSALLERACQKLNAIDSLASYTALKNIILAMKQEAKPQSEQLGADAESFEVVVDNAKSAGRLRGANAYKRGGDRHVD